MVRDLLFKGKEEARNNDIQRIEALSDGVFAFAVTLLIVSLEVPKNFDELLINMRGFFAFGVSFLLLFFIWREQYVFFRRYGLDDSITMILNGVLLFLVLYYVYPLKFLFTLLFSNHIYGPGESPIKIRPEEVPSLMIVYGLGYISIYLLFFLMHLHAYRNRQKLALTEQETFDCKTNIYKLLILAAIGACSVLVAVGTRKSDSGISGMVYFLIPVALTIFFTLRKKKRRGLFNDFPRNGETK